jgi:signal transduction histidine kinase
MILTFLHLLDWAVIAVSFFNTVALLWLGLTVLLNAERRHFGTWAAGGGLLFGGLFFVGHSAVVGRVLGTFGGEMELWWRLGWLPFIGGPYLWYLVVAWYTGVLRVGRHRLWLALVTALGLVALALLALADPLPSFSQVAYERSPAAPQPVGVPAVVLIYPVYSVLCVALALLALRRPAASERFMGDAARRRARPWLVAASLALLAVSLAVGGAAAWLLVELGRGTLPGASPLALVLIMGFDLLISGLIALITVFAGQALVSYEIFTGRTLPRRGLHRYWRRSLILAAGYGTLVGGSLALPIPIDPIWQLMLATVLMTLFFALLSWRSYIDRDQTMARLRPFVASQHLYDRLLHPAASASVVEDAAAAFRALCEEVLGAERAVLFPLGPLAPLVRPLAYPDRRRTTDDERRTTDDRGPKANDHRPPTKDQRLDARGEGNLLSATMPGSDAVAEPSSVVLGLSSTQPGALCLPLDPATSGGMEWMVPLWSERGRIGALLLGPKREGGFYTEEEIELARAAGERLVDAAAGAEMARRLMHLQRRHMAESQVVDRRTRRMLHDDVLPRIHELMLMLQTRATDAPVAAGPADSALRLPSDGSPAELAPALDALAALHRQIADLLHAVPGGATPVVAHIGLLPALRHCLEHEYAGAFEQVSWQIEPSAEAAAARLEPLVAEVAFYALREAARNAARHGRGADHARPLHLRAGGHLTTGSLAVFVEDDGVGFGDVSRAGGTGRGLELHSTLLAVVGGALTVDSSPGVATRVTVSVADNRTI